MVIQNAQKTFRGIFLSLRVKPLLLGMGPVLLGASLAFPLTKNFSYSLNLLILTCVLCIQIATHFFNDYLDFLKGADSFFRTGPKRALQLGLLSPKKLWILGNIFLFFSCLIGFFLIHQGGIFIFFVGSISLCLAYLYTGGPYPLAYTGLADIFVLLFFGIIPVLGTFYLNTGYFHEDSIFIGLQCGLIALSFLVVNNLRDEKADRLANKKTLVVRWGVDFGKKQWLICHILFHVLHCYWLLKWSVLFPFSKIFYTFLPFLLVPFSFYLYRTLTHAFKESFFYKKVFNFLLLQYLLFTLCFMGLFLYI